MKYRLIVGAAFTSALVLVSTLGISAASAASLRVCPTARPGCAFTSIQAAVNAAPSGSTITIAPGTYREHVVIGPGAPTSLKLVGEGGAAAVTIDAQQRDSVLTILPGHTVSLVGLTLTNGLAGGAAGGNGGGILSVGSTLTVIDSRIVNNTASGALENNQGLGGGIFNIDALPPATAAPGAGTLKLISTLVSGNHATNGGGVSSISFTAGVTTTITSSVIENNTATGGGAGGVQSCGTLEMVNTPLRNNTAQQGGGLTNCGNPPSGPSGTARLVNSPVTGNHAVGGQSNGPSPAGHGGGISNGGALTLVSSPVTGNTATGPGGGIFNAPPGTVSRLNSPVTGNTGNPPAAAQCAGTTC